LNSIIKRILIRFGSKKRGEKRREVLDWQSSQSTTNGVE
jgi:hypothetical protein